MVAPITIKIIIHYYVTPDSGCDYRDSQEFRSNVDMLINVGLLKETGKEKRKYTAVRGACEVYLNALCEVPFPELKWVIPSE